MKKLLLSLCSVSLSFMFSGCADLMNVSHNGNFVGIGKVTRLGVADYGLVHVNGLAVLQAVRENNEMVIETNDGDGYTNPAATIKGIRTIRFRTGPQITGYLVDLAKHDTEAAKAYVDQMADLNKASWDTKQQTPTDVKLPSVTTMQGTKKVAEKVKELVEPFTCSGNCDLQDLWKNDSIAYQTAVASKLLTYADDTSSWEGDVTTYKKSLQDFLTRLAKLTVKGKTKTQMRVKYAKIANNKLIDLMYVMIEPDQEFDTTCPECVLLEE